MRDIASWLERNGLAKYVQLFADEAIDLQTLAKLTDQDLKQLGLPLGHRRKILEGIAQLAAERSGMCIGEDVQTSQACADPISEPERRQVTILFCDLINSTALSRRLDPEELCELMGAYQQTCAEPIERYGGFIARFIGDGILAYFGYPLAHEDDAERAVRAGIGIVESISTLNFEGRREQAEALAVRIGISTGDVVVGYAVGKGTAQESAVAGEAANLAAKLQQLAEPNTVVVSKITKELTCERFEFRDGGVGHIGGYETPVPYWFVTSERANGRSERIGRPVATLVGRQQESAVLLQQWNHAAAGRGRAALVRGRAGIGKSRLIGAVREHVARARSSADRRAPSIMSFSCSPFRSNRALYPVIHEIARLAGLGGTDTATISIRKLRRYLVRSGVEPRRQTLTPFAELMGIGSHEHHPGATHSAQAIGTQEKWLRTLGVLQDLFLALARRQPLLLVFEDIQWIDYTTGLLLARMVDVAATASVAILISQRTDPTEAKDAASLAGELAKWLRLPHFVLCDLDKLDHADAKRLIADAALGQPLPPSVTEAILQRAEGVPLYIEELTRTLIDSAERAYPGGDPKDWPQSIPIPDTLSGALMARLDQSGPGKIVAQHASVIGRDFSVDVLQRVTTLAHDRLMEGIAMLVTADIIKRAGPTHNSLYVFKHALIQETAYRSLLRRRRKEIHLRVALALAQLKRHDFDPLDDVIAQHYARGGRLAEAISWWRRAAAGSFARSAHVEAGNLLGHALDAIRLQGDATKQQLLELDIAADLAAALRSTRGYAAPEVEHQYIRARELSDKTGDLSKRFNIEWGLMQCHLVKGNVKTAHEIASDLFKYAAEHQDRPLADAHLAAGMVKLHLGDFPAARSSLEKGVELSRADGDAPHYFTHGQNSRVFCRSYLAQALWFLGNVDQAKTIIDENLTMARRRAMKGAGLYTYVNTLTFAARVYCYRRDPAAVHKISDELIQISRQNHYAYYEAQGIIHQGWAMAAQNSLISGIRQMRDGLAALERTGTVLGLRGFCVQLADLLLAAGDAVSASTMLDASTDLTHGSRMWDAEIERVRGVASLLPPVANTEVAEAAFRKSLDVARRQHALALQLRTAISYARLLHRLKRTRDACDLLNDTLQKMSEGNTTRDMLDAQASLAELELAERHALS